MNKVVHLNLSIERKLSINEENLNLSNTPKHHFWQFILNENCISGTIETIPIPKEKLTSQDAFLPHFYDVPLSYRLKNRHSFRVNLDHAHLYFDHNFGFAPLHTIKEKWCWWHTEQGKNWEVIYFFPRIKKLFYISCLNGKIFNSKEENKNFILKEKLNLFFYFFPKKVNSMCFGKISFNKIIECAPFYLRSKFAGENLSSTMEFLIPKRVLNPVNKILTSARKIKVNKIIKNEDFLESFLSFEDICLKVTKENGRSFFFSSFIMPKKERIKSYFVYTICRIIDDGTDGLKKELDLKNDGASFSKIFIDILWDENIILDELFINKMKKKLSSCSFFYLNENSVVNFINQSRVELNKLNLSKKYFEELIQGQLMDENFLQPKNFEELYLYCFRVAGVVGLMMAKIFLVKEDQKAIEAAEHLGIAMQITNILRDVKEDFQRGRIYLPEDFCLKNNIVIDENCFSNFENLKEQKSNLIKELCEKAIFYYKSSIFGIPYIPKIRYRFCVRLMLAIYASILSNIMREKRVVFKKRVVISKPKKILIFFKVIFGRNPLSAAGVKQNGKI